MTRIEDSIDDMVLDIFNEITSDFSDRIPQSKRKLVRFINAFNSRFPANSPAERGRASALAWAVMGIPLELFALGFNSSVIVELCSILERFSIREVIIHTLKPSKRLLMAKNFEHFTLQDTAPILVELGYLEKKDLKFIKKLCTLRNAVAHKNPRKISNVLLGGKAMHFLDIDSVMEKIDSLPFILETISLLSKMSKKKKVK